MDRIGVRKKKKTVTSLLVALILVLTLSGGFWGGPLDVRADTVTPETPFVDFSLNAADTVNAHWDQAGQTLTITGNGKIEIGKWKELAQKFSTSSYTSGDGWKNSDFTLKIQDSTVQLPDNTVVDSRAGFFGDFTGSIEINSEIDTSNVTDMSWMFSGIDVANPDVSKWNVSNVTNMMCIFAGAKVANPDVSKWDVGNVTNMAYMFSGTDAANPDVSKWDVGNVTNMSFMFSNAEVANPDVSGWDVGNVTDMWAMFADTKAANPDVSGWDVSNVTKMGYMFQGAKAITALDLTQWNTAKVTTATGMFNDMESLEFLFFKGLPLDKIENINGPYVVTEYDAFYVVVDRYGPFVKGSDYAPMKYTAYMLEVVDSYSVTVKGGTADKSDALTNEKVTIKANVPAGKEFTGWTVEGGGVMIDDPTNPNTAFTMEYEDVVIKANFKDQGKAGTSTSKAGTITPKGGTSNPKTGDSGLTEMAAILMILGAAATVTLGRRKFDK